MIPVTDTIALSPDDIEERFIRAPGPGGQNVNKVASAVQLRFDAARCAALPEAVRRRLIRLAGARATREGVIVITAHRFRAQERNRRDALDRLIALIRRAAEPPKPRRPTRPTAAARTRRLTAKKRRAAIKKTRRTGPRDINGDAP